MKQIIVQADGRLAFLGRLTVQSQEMAQINGRDTSDGAFTPAIGNLNAAPLAHPETGFLGSTRIATPNGPVAIADLEAGDTVTGADGSPIRIQHILKTPLTRKAICLRSPYFGLDQDLIVGENHRIAITSDIAEYLFGAETVLVPVWALKDGRKAQYWETGPKTHLYQIQLETLAAIKVGHCILESMPKSGQSVGKVLSEEEARCFACEHKSGYQN